jgi:heptosyltransferase-2
LSVDPAAAAQVADLLAVAGVAEGTRLLALAPGSAWPTKRWPTSGFARAASALLSSAADRAVIVGAAGDRGLALEIASLVARERTTGEGVGRESIIDLTGKTDVAGLVALLARATLVIANDSAPAHVAAALGRPTVAIFGPTVPRQGFAPLGTRVALAERDLDCRPCSRHGGEACPIDTHACLAGLDVRVVLEAARRLEVPGVAQALVAGGTSA